MTAGPTVCLLIELCFIFDLYFVCGVRMGVGTHACHTHSLHSCACGMGPQVDTGRFPLDCPPLSLEAGSLVELPMSAKPSHFVSGTSCLGLQVGHHTYLAFSWCWGYLCSTELSLRQILTL